MDHMLGIKPVIYNLVNSVLNIKKVKEQAGI